MQKRNSTLKDHDIINVIFSNSNDQFCKLYVSENHKKGQIGYQLDWELKGKITKSFSLSFEKLVEEAMKNGLSHSIIALMRKEFTKFKESISPGSTYLGRRVIQNHDQRKSNLFRTGMKNGKRKSTSITTK